MAKKVVVDLDVKADSKKADKALKDIKKNLKDVDTEAKKAFSTEDVSKLNKEMGNTTKVAVDVRQKLRDLQNRMAEIGDVGSAEFQKLAVEAGKYKDQMNNANAAIKSMSADFPKMALIGGGLQALGGAAQGATGAMMLFGAENEEATKAIQKMMAIQQMMNAVNAMSNSLSDESALGLKVRTVLTNLKARASTKDAAATGTQTVAQGALTIATNIGSAAMAGLNAIMNLNPVLLLITGIAALGAAMYAFAPATEDATEANEKFNDSLNKTLSDREEAKKAFEKSEDVRRREMILSGATAEELHNDDIERIKTAERIRKDDIKVVELANKGLYASNKLLALQGKDEEIKANNDTIKKNRDKYKQLLLDGKDYHTKLREENKQFADKTLEDDKAAREKRRAAGIAWRDNRRTAQRKIENDLLAIKEESYQTDIERQELRHKQQLEDIARNAKLTGAERARLEGIEKEKQELALAKIDKKWDKKELDRVKAQRAKLDKEGDDYIKRQDELDALEFSMMQEGLDKEIEAIVASYDAKYLLAKDNAELIAQLDKDRDAKIATATAEHRTKEQEAELEQIELLHQAQSEKIEALSSLNDIVFNIRMNNAKRGGEEEFKIAKQSFKINKALQLSQAGMDAHKAISSFLAVNPLTIGGIPNPGALSGLIKTSAMQAINIAKIASVKFQGTKPTTGAPSGAGGIGGVASTSPSPQFNVVGDSPANQLAQTLGSNENTPIKAFVVSSDITSAQGLDRNIVESATL